MNQVPLPIHQCPNEWYNLSPTYEGEAELTFAGWETPVVGRATFEIRENGPEITFTSEGSTSLGESNLQGHSLTPTSLRIQCPDGEFIANYKLFLRKHRFTFGASTDTPETFVISAIGATFEVKNQEAPSYLVLPLYNMLSPAFVTHPRPMPVAIDSHPLRIFTTPQSATPGDLANPNYDRILHNQLVTFDLDGSVGFIEALPQYKEIRELLQKNPKKAQITSLLVCNSGDHICKSNDPQTWFPIDLLNLLTIGTGTRVGAPWVEYRDSQGRLVRRVHVTFGKPELQELCPLFVEPDGSGLTRLLTAGLKNEHLGTHTTRIVCTHYRNAGNPKRSIDDRFLSLSRAFEALAKQEALSTQNISAGISGSQMSLIRTELEKCQKAINVIANAATSQDERDTIQRVASRVGSSTQKDKRFGNQVADLAEKMGFSDRHVLMNGYVSSCGRNWIEFLSFLRGSVVHEGGFDSLGGQIDLLEIDKVIRHLHDLLARILLKSLNAHGLYAPQIRYSMPPCQIDWVTQKTQAEELIPTN